MSSPNATPSSPIEPTPPPMANVEDAPVSIPEAAPTPAPNAPTAETPVPPASTSAESPKDDVAPIPDSQKNEQPPVPPVQKEAPPIPQTPQVYLTFLLLSGHRRTMNFEPATGIGRVKEVVWNAWTGGDWPTEDRPPAPSYLRVLHAGRMLQDDETLANLKLPIYTPPATSESTPHPQPTATIVHISVRPFGPGIDDLDSGSVKKGGTRRRGRRDGTATSDGDAMEEPRSGCCGCIIC